RIATNHVVNAGKTKRKETDAEKSGGGRDPCCGTLPTLPRSRPARPRAGEVSGSADNSAVAYDSAMPNEADTCRLYVVPKLQAAGWDTEPCAINEQRTFTDGRIVTAGRRARRRPGKRADYLLRYRPDFAIAVVEAKPSYATPGDGLQQAKDYAEILGLKFAYGTNGHGIVEFDFLTGVEREIESFPTPGELWNRLLASRTVAPEVAERLLTPSFRNPKKIPR